MSGSHLHMEQQQQPAVVVGGAYYCDVDTPPSTAYKSLDDDGLLEQGQQVGHQQAHYALVNHQHMYVQQQQDHLMYQPRHQHQHQMQASHQHLQPPTSFYQLSSSFHHHHQNTTQMAPAQAGHFQPSQVHYFQQQQQPHHHHYQFSAEQQAPIYHQHHQQQDYLLQQQQPPHHHYELMQQPQQLQLQPHHHHQRVNPQDNFYDDFQGRRELVTTSMVGDGGINGAGHIDELGNELLQQQQQQQSVNNPGADGDEDELYYHHQDQMDLLPTIKQQQEQQRQQQQQHHHHHSMSPAALVPALPQPPPPMSQHQQHQHQHQPQRQQHQQQQQQYSRAEGMICKSRLGDNNVGVNEDDGNEDDEDNQLHSNSHSLSHLHHAPNIPPLAQSSSPSQRPHHHQHQHHQQHQPQQTHLMPPGHQHHHHQQQQLQQQQQQQQLQLLLRPRSSDLSETTTAAAEREPAPVHNRRSLSTALAPPTFEGLQEPPRRLSPSSTESLGEAQQPSPRATRVSTMEGSDEQQVSRRQQQQQELVELASYGGVAQDWLDTICRHLIEHMSQFGICVIDNFLGQVKAEMILKEVQQLYHGGQHSKGRLVSNRLAGRPGDPNSTSIRSDRVIWIDGCEEGCAEINNLIQTLCSVITNSSRLSLYSNNGLDKVVINKRTRAHVTCYPGNGTRYIKHVDNPNGDGRVITSIYYMNKDWFTKRDGGLLRMYPAGMDEVANIEPLFDRVLFFWSDRRNPHEVLPAYRDRFAITVWYIGEERQQV